MRSALIANCTHSAGSASASLPTAMITRESEARYKNFIHSPMQGKGKRSGVADRSMASPTYNKNMSIWISDY